MGPVVGEGGCDKERLRGRTLSHLKVSPFGGQVQRGPAFTVEHVHSGMVVQHGVHQSHVAPVTGDQQRRPADARLSVHRLLHFGRRHTVQHGRQHVVVAGHRAEVQRRLVMLKLCIYVYI